MRRRAHGSPTLRRILLLPACVALAACAGGPGGDGDAAPPPDVVRGVEGTRRVAQLGETVGADVAAPQATVFAVLDSVFADLGLEVTTRAPREGLIASAGKRLTRLHDRRASHWVDCGSTISGPIADEAQVLVSVTSTVTPRAGGGSVLTTRVDSEARARGTMEGYRDCTSTGRLEALLLEQVRGRLGGRG